MRFFILLLLAPAVLTKKVVCPGGSFSCPDVDTCCQLIDKSYGCCPMKDAVCCDDHIHCCPPLTKCSSGMCLQSSNTSIESFAGVPVIDKSQDMSLETNLIQADYVLCPDAQVCPNDTTCCENTDTGIYGCCPLKNAVCCGDGVHCCPTGTSCDVREGKCEGDVFTLQMYDAHKKAFRTGSSKFSRLVTSTKVGNVICPDNIFQCPDLYTCCKLPNGHWGCCPFDRATCCVDHIHCCPENMNCDPTSQYCSSGPGLNNTKVQGMPLIGAIPSKLNTEAEQIPTYVVCPDKTQCFEGTTCCQLLGGKFGCCQYKDATCCPDHLHCCPSGDVCDIRRKSCISASGNWVVNFLSRYFDNLRDKAQK